LGIVVRTEWIGDRWGIIVSPLIFLEGEANFAVEPGSRGVKTVKIVSEEYSIEVIGNVYSQENFPDGWTWEDTGRFVSAVLGRYRETMGVKRPKGMRQPEKPIARRVRISGPEGETVPRKPYAATEVAPSPEPPNNVGAAAVAYGERLRELAQQRGKRSGRVYREEVRYSSSSSDNCGSSC
jgi:hypothetical protein